MKKRKRLTFISRPYSCSECHKSFTQQSSLATHRRIHSGEKPFSCEICRKEFTNAGNMKIHMRVHTGERPFQCDHCQRGFSQQSSLKAHLRIHSGEKPFSCSQCDKCFRVIGNLRKHEVVHSEETPYECDKCYKKFKLKEELKKHEKSLHGINASLLAATSTQEIPVFSVQNDVSHIKEEPSPNKESPDLPIENYSTTNINFAGFINPPFFSNSTLDTKFIKVEPELESPEPGPLSTLDLDAINKISNYT